MFLNTCLLYISTWFSSCNVKCCSHYSFQCLFGNWTSLRVYMNIPKGEHQCPFPVPVFELVFARFMERLDVKSYTSSHLLHFPNYRESMRTSMWPPVIKLVVLYIVLSHPYHFSVLVFTGNFSSLTVITHNNQSSACQVLFIHKQQWELTNHYSFTSYY